ncbi:MAG TPA: threonine ammonia-lyase [Thermoplasmata archaeon]|nr:threonine ammonia-lyase [Thermoplasmata archaeon]
MAGSASAETLPVTIQDIERARGVLEGIVRRTPLVRAPELPGLAGADLYLKLENLQVTGAFKIRGAVNRLSQLSEEAARRGVIAASAGNHAQGVAWAARARKVPATIVMARSASPLKVEATEALGAKVVLHGADYEEAHEEAMRRAVEDRLTYIHPFDDPAVIAGQGTVGLEIVDDLPNVRRVIVGVGGGGLMAGIGIAVKARRPDADLVAVQPTGADTLRASLTEGRVVVGGRPSTFADGLATRHVGDAPLRILRSLGARGFVADDRSIARAVFLLLEKGKILAEGAGAAPIAALLDHPELAKDGPVVAVVSGGNLDPFVLDRVLFIGLSAEGRLLWIRSALRDTPGTLREFLEVAAAASANVRRIDHDRESPERPPGMVTVELELEVRDAEHGEAVLAAYHERGYVVERRA